MATAGPNKHMDVPPRVAAALGCSPDGLEWEPGRWFVKATWTAAVDDPGFDIGARSAPEIVDGWNYQRQPPEPSSRAPPRRAADRRGRLGR